MSEQLIPTKVQRPLGEGGDVAFVDKSRRTGLTLDRVVRFQPCDVRHPCAAATKPTLIYNLSSDREPTRGTAAARFGVLAFTARCTSAAGRVPQSGPQTGTLGTVLHRRQGSL
jgi:hypothetical protein